MREVDIVWDKGDPQQTVLVTGGAGFIGSNFIPYFLEQHPDYRVINVDILTYAGNLEYLRDLQNNPRYKFIKGDICNRELMEFIFCEYDIRGVIHFASESHVDNSIMKPDVFMITNVNGTFILLDVARNYWMKTPLQIKKGYEKCRFHYISTDEVYGSLGSTGMFTEDSPYAPNSPYSASKASAELVVRSYWHTYGLNVVTSNSSNNYGPNQHMEKLIPTIIRKALAGEPIPIYGDGLNVRDWVYVLDHCKGIDLVYHFGRTGEKYNIGGKNELENIEIARSICAKLDALAPERLKKLKIKSYQDLISFVTDRPGHDRRYAVSTKKMETEMGWNPQSDFHLALLDTVMWYLQIHNKDVE